MTLPPPFRPRGRVVLVNDVSRAREIARCRAADVTLWCWTAAGLLDRDRCRGSATWLPPVDLAIVTTAASRGVWNEAFFASVVAVAEPVVLEELADVAMAGAVRRIGRLVIPALVRMPLTAADMVGLGLADLLVPATADPLEWVRQWVAGRSVPALASATFVLRNRLAGGILERFEFARLFSLGEPQEGMRRFLGKQPLDFSATTEWEIA